MRTFLRTELARCWSDSRPLTATAALMLGVLAANMVGLVVDDRIITGVPAWLKPAKFAISVVIYTLTFAWLFRFLPNRPRLRTWTERIIAATLILEIIIIDLQAWRGTTSHFNVATRFDQILFVTMGSAIVVLWIASVVVGIALFRTRFADPAWGRLLKISMLITLLGAAFGGAMTRPTHAQIEGWKQGGAVTVSGAHTVGAPDGGAGIPGVGWSTQHGDLRISHFFGLHALQLLPLLYLVIRRLRSPSRRLRLSTIVPISYGLFVVLLMWQAVRGQSIVMPDDITVRAFAILCIATLFAVFVSMVIPPREKVT